MDDFLVPRDLLDRMTIETNQDKYLRSIKESLDVTVPEIKEISYSAKDQAQSAIDQVEQLKRMNANLETQIKDAKSSAIIADIVAIFSLLFAIATYFH